MTIDLDRFHDQVFNQDLLLAVLEIIEIEIGAQDLIRSYQEPEGRS